MVRMNCTFHLATLAMNIFFHVMSTNLDIWKIRSNYSIHDSPDMCYRILVSDLNPKLFSDEALCTFTTEQILRPDSFCDVAVKVLELYFHGIGLILAIIIEAHDC